MYRYNRKMTIDDLLQPDVILDVCDETRNKELSPDNLSKIYTGISYFLRFYPDCEILIRNKRKDSK